MLANYLGQISFNHNYHNDNDIIDIDNVCNNYQIKNNVYSQVNNFKRRSSLKSGFLFD